MESRQLLDSRREFGLRGFGVGILRCVLLGVCRCAFYRARALYGDGPRPRLVLVPSSFLWVAWVPARLTLDYCGWLNPHNSARLIGWISRAMDFVFYVTRRVVNLCVARKDITNVNPPQCRDVNPPFPSLKWYSSSELMPPLL